jgi:hypothetical protein
LFGPFVTNSIKCTNCGADKAFVVELCDFAQKIVQKWRLRGFAALNAMHLELPKWFWYDLGQQ